MNYQLSGRLHVIYETKQISERFSKREFVVETADNPKYPQHVLIQLTGDRCSHLDHFKIGDTVRVEFSVRGREWTSPTGDIKYFNSLDAWQVEGDRGRADDEPPPMDEEPPVFDDDVPF